jgi:hypothetical protein
MGLDIHIATDRDALLIDEAYLVNHDDNVNLHGLSRDFCNFILRKHNVDHETELEQLEQIAGIDLKCIHELDEYPDEEYIEVLLEQAATEAEAQAILANVEANKAKLEGNIDKVLDTATRLIEALSANEDFYTKFIMSDSSYESDYFTDFNKHKGSNYIDNNFGQDLRNFKRYLDYAKLKGATTAWFVFG